ncbi:MAG: hypothetical protein AB7N54_03065 [Alphaproteobacteria bacterium]
MAAIASYLLTASAGLFVVLACLGLGVSRIMDKINGDIERALGSKINRWILFTSCSPVKSSNEPIYEKTRNMILKCSKKRYVDYIRLTVYLFFFTFILAIVGGVLRNLSWP